MSEAVKVGVISCSGEEIAGGTISRLAARRVLELLRPQATVTLCLPLFLAGEEQERRFARLHPTLTVDGCDKLCAKRGTEQYSGPVAASLVVSDVLGERLGKCHRSARDFDQADEEAVWLVAERIAAAVDALANVAPAEQAAPDAGASCGCACGAAPAGNLTIGGKAVIVNGLPLIFAHLVRQGLAPGEGAAEQLLETVRIYHEVPEDEADLYRAALTTAFTEHCRRQSQ